MGVALSSLFIAGEKVRGALIDIFSKITSVADNLCSLLGEKVQDTIVDVSI